jgi:formate/nitrite transporter FocA (FNT family)
MWLPITIFFAHGYEHSIVNMFVVPAGILLGAPVTFSSWWIWNQIPVTLGNLVGGMLLTGLAIYITHRPDKTGREIPVDVPPQASHSAEHAGYSASF